MTAKPLTALGNHPGQTVDDADYDDDDTEHLQVP